MILKETITIDAQPSAVWEYLGSPEVWPLFHAKAGETNLISGQGETVGAQYKMLLRLGSRSTLTRCEIAERQTDHLIAVDSIKFDEDDPSKQMAARITYTLTNIGDKTKVVEKIEFDSKLIPFFVRPIVWFLFRFGRSSGETTLQGLRRVVEGNCHDITEYKLPKFE